MGSRSHRWIPKTNLVRTDKFPPHVVNGDCNYYSTSTVRTSRTALQGLCGLMDRHENMKTLIKPGPLVEI
jgi:hypothetical protein